MKKQIQQIEQIMAEHTLRQLETDIILLKAICRNCGQRNGEHSFFGDLCPDVDGIRRSVPTTFSIRLMEVSE